LKFLQKHFSSVYYVWAKFHFEISTVNQAMSRQSFFGRARILTSSARYYFVKDYHDEKIIILKFVSTDTNVADLLTKPLGPSQIQIVLSQHTLYLYFYTSLVT
jgi:hypothetical protein